MYKTIALAGNDGQIYHVFICDMKTGNTAKDILRLPGVYADVGSSENTSLKMVSVEGNIGAYQTKMLFLCVDKSVLTQDVTGDIAKFLSMPETAVNAVLRSMPEDEQGNITDTLETVHYYESLKKEDKFCIPADAFVGFSAEEISGMTSQRMSYAIKPTDNQEMFQASYDGEYGILLPSLDDIHSSNTDLISALDILRVLAPYRREVHPGVYTYDGIYHTPYFKVNPQIKGRIPSYLQWMNGFSGNDMLDITANERHMANNLQSFIYSDISRYVAEITSGIFFDSPLGSLLSKLCTRKDDEVMQQLYKDIKERSTDDASCEIPFSEWEELKNGGWYQADIVRAIQHHLKFADNYLQTLITERPTDRRTVECDNLPFVLQLSDSQEQTFTELMISMGYISTPMQRFLIDLCKKAYRVTWGHTGATLAIPGFADQVHIAELNDALGHYIADMKANQLPEPGAYPSLYVASVANPDDSGFISDDSEEKDDEPFIGTDYYVTTDTAQKIEAGSLSYDFFSTKATAAQTTEAAIVEYWRNVNGETNLDNFVSSALLQTADPTILVECIIKMMRWGDRKPKLLVLQKHPEIRYVFDLGTGLRADNTAIVDESELVKFNGCDFSLQGFLYSESNSTLPKEEVIGFVLAKDYGSVKKTYLASWLDIGEMTISGNIQIGDFVAVNKVELSDETRRPIEYYSREGHDFYVSDFCIKQGLKLTIQPKDLNALALLTTPGILDSREYLRSLRGDSIITTRDRQYDILRRYVQTLNAFYTQHGAAINSVQNTMELSTLAESFCALFNSQGEGKQEANTVAASATIKTLDLSNSTASIKWDSTELTGKFYIVSDMEMVSTLPPIEFSHDSLKATAAKVRNRVVLLLLQKDNKFIFCRKDIMPSDVMILQVPDGNGGTKKALGHKTYKTFSVLINNLCKGVDATINKQPAFLHESLKGYF